jgi:hypothetical protein
MIIYNETVNITIHAHDLWMKWLQEEHLPEIMATNTFYDVKIYQLINVDDIDGPTYSIQFYAMSMKEYDLFIEEFEPVLRSKSAQKWGNDMLSFRTTLQNVPYNNKENQLQTVNPLG